MMGGLGQNNRRGPEVFHELGSTSISTTLPLQFHEDGLCARLIPKFAADGASMGKTEARCRPNTCDYLKLSRFVRVL